MATSAKDRQIAYRERYARRGAALNDIIAALEGNDKPLAVKLRSIAEDGLK